MGSIQILLISVDGIIINICISVLLNEKNFKRINYYVIFLLVVVVIVFHYYDIVRLSKLHQLSRSAKLCKFSRN
ncbi:hypothetical protein BpHYR1_025633 [Brachionus plicatilis]|uniref:Uncharacterized protein n=1 Tax=Brachionus plicatilis TaxID=10195 RepID=A0A3M7SUI6_BRAPC|nr:hypothetical protein BpHYR1_025633 [Brachionus plicatilis]